MKGRHAGEILSHQERMRAEPGTSAPAAKLIWYENQPGRVWTCFSVLQLREVWVLFFCLFFFFFALTSVIFGAPEGK